MKICILVIISGFFVSQGYAQAPVIQTITPASTGPQGRVVITGSGFNSTPAQIAVFFDNIKATVVSSSTFSIQVDVPPQAHFGNVEVVNLSSGLSAKSTVKFLESFGGATFDATKVSTPTTFSATRQLFDICNCDFDLDGLPDLGVTKFSGADDVAASDLIILKNKSTPGAISFTQFDKTNLSALNMNFPAININCGDLNGDGKPDLVASRAGGTKNVVFILRNTNTVAGTLSFAPVQSLFLDLSQFAFRISIRDLNLDGKPELIVSNSFDDPATDNIVYVFVNQSSGSAISFNPTPVKVTVTGANTTYGLDVQDLDGDQKPDIVVHQFQADDIFVLRNTSTSLVSFEAPVKIVSPGTYNNVSTADLNQDGQLDLMITSSSDNSMKTFINQSTPGKISFKAPVSYPTATQPWGIDGSDIDGDGDIDIVVANRQDNFLSVFVNDGSAAPSFTRANLTTTKPSINLKVGDLDGDAKPDIAFTSASSTSQFSIDIIRNTNCVVPRILNPAPAIICSGQTITLKTTPTAGVTFDWRESNVSMQSGPSPTFDITAPGSFTVIATAEGGACANTSSVFSVSNSAGVVPPNPVITVNPTTPVCIAGTVQLSTTAVSGATYQWTGPKGFTSTSQSPTVTNITATSAGLYKLQITVGTCKSNETSQIVDVVTFPSFIVSSSAPLPACISTGTTLTVNSLAGYQYKWLNNSVVIPGQTTTSLVVNSEGSYSVLVTDTGFGCTSETAKVAVQLYTVPVASFTAPATVCVKVSVSLTSSSTFDSRGTPSYAWAFGDGTTSTVQSPTHTYATSGIKNVSLAVGYSGVTGCSNASLKDINSVDAVVPVITAPVSLICPTQTVVLSVAGTFNTITWNTGATTNSLTVTTAGDYSVNTVDQNKCSASSIPFTLAAGKVPTLTLSADKTTINPGETLQLTASGADTYLWSPAESLDNPASATPLAKPLVSLSYVVKGSIAGGCSATDSLKIKVLPGTTIPAPLIFTPNGDGDNDLWKIPGIENFPDCTISVFDGHGSRVYERKGYINDWDGTYNGNQLPETVYFYVYSCPDRNQITGTVMIKR